MRYAYSAVCAAAAVFFAVVGFLALDDNAPAAAASAFSAWFFLCVYAGIGVRLARRG